MQTSGVSCGGINSVCSVFNLSALRCCSAIPHTSLLLFRLLCESGGDSPSVWYHTPLTDGRRDIGCYKWSMGSFIYNPGQLCFARLPGLDFLYAGGLTWATKNPSEVSRSGRSSLLCLSVSLSLSVSVSVSLSVLPICCSHLCHSLSSRMS